MKRVFFLIPAIIIGLQSFAQNMKDLGTLKFKEHTQTFLSDMPGAKGYTMYQLSNMLSYGIDNNGSFIFHQYKPPHIELLSFNDKVGGYAFKIMDYKNQEEIGKVLQVMYPKLRMTDSSRWSKQYDYRDENVVVDFRSVSAQDFKEGRNGYLSIMSRNLKDAIDMEEKRYQKK